jgi:serine/threonine-protein kinase
MTEPVPAREEPRDSLVGKTIADRYSVVRRLGRGGMGVVYEARHLALGRSVAIKVLKSDRAREGVARARFEREARAAASAGSEHIVEVHDFGTTPEGEPYIVMELLEGMDLAALIAKEGALPTGRALGIARQLGRALAAAHDKGIIHRDLKSENVFVVDRDGKDFVKLLDFGISKIHDGGDDPGLTGSDVLLGTPRYMAPEQARGETDLDGRVDVYALGVILYEMLTSRVPFLGRTSLEIVQKHLHATPDSIRGQRADVTEEVERVVMRALAKDRDERFHTVRDLCAVLPIAEAHPGGDRAWPVPTAVPGRASASPSDQGVGSGVRTQPERPEVRRIPRGSIMVGALLVALAAGIALWPSPPERRPRPVERRRALDRPARIVEERIVRMPAKAEPPVVIEIRAVPDSARIRVGDEVRGRGTARIEAPRSELPIPVRVEADGYAAQELLLVPREDAVREVRLERLRRGALTGAVPPAPPGAEATESGPPPPTKAPDDLMGNPYRKRQR